jgi:hypothetical protein
MLIPLNRMDSGVFTTAKPGDKTGGAQFNRREKVSPRVL